MHPLAAAALVAATLAAPGPPPGPATRAAPPRAARPAPGAQPARPLVDAAALIPDALLDVRYATTRNFTGRQLYPAARCLLLAPVAERLARAAARLRAGGHRLVLHDCYRPLSVQRQLWEVLPRPGLVANPATGSHHNRAAAVDVALADRDGRPLALPTGYDEFGPRARAGATAGIPAAALENRRTLRAALEAEGFRVNPSEWWHFDAPEARGAPLLDVPLLEAGR